MKIPYISKPDFENLDGKFIRVNFSNHEKEGVFVRKPDNISSYDYRLIYRDSETCINEIFLEGKNLRYLGKEKIISKNAMVWCHHKQFEGGIWPSQFSELDKLLNEKI